MLELLKSRARDAETIPGDSIRRAAMRDDLESRRGIPPLFAEEERERLVASGDSMASRGGSDDLKHLLAQVLCRRAPQIREHDDSDALRGEQCHEAAVAVDFAAM